MSFWHIISFSFFFLLFFLFMIFHFHQMEFFSKHSNVGDQHNYISSLFFSFLPFLLPFLLICLNPIFWLAFIFGIRKSLLSCCVLWHMRHACENNNTERLHQHFVFRNRKQSQRTTRSTTWTKLLMSVRIASRTLEEMCATNRVEQTLAKRTHASIFKMN